MIETVPVGVLGVGSIAEAMVVGWCDGVAEPPDVVLSPRGSRAAELGRRFATVAVAADNQDVVDRTGTVVVCLRPQDAAALGELAFTAEHRVVSVVAALPIASLAELVAPAQVVGRAIPLPAVARRQGTTAVFSPDPTDPAARSLFEPLGSVVAVSEEDALDAMSAATATVAAHLAYLTTIGRWLAAHGVAEDEAFRYVSETFAPLADDLERAPSELPRLAAGHATRGGLNEQFLASLESAGVLDRVSDGLDELLARVRGGTT